MIDLPCITSGLLNGNYQECLTHIAGLYLSTGIDATVLSDYTVLMAHTGDLFERKGYTAEQITDTARTSQQFCKTLEGIKKESTKLITTSPCVMCAYSKTFMGARVELERLVLYAVFNSVIYPQDIPPENISTFFASYECIHPNGMSPLYLKFNCMLASAFTYYASFGVENTDIDTVYMWVITLYEDQLRKYCSTENELLLVRSALRDKVTVFVNTIQPVEKDNAFAAIADLKKSYADFYRSAVEGGTVPKRKPVKLSRSKGSISRSKPATSSVSGMTDKEKASEMSTNPTSSTPPSHEMNQSAPLGLDVMCAINEVLGLDDTKSSPTVLAHSPESNTEQKSSSAVKPKKRSVFPNAEDISDADCLESSGVTPSELTPDDIPAITMSEVSDDTDTPCVAETGTVRDAQISDDTGHVEDVDDTGNDSSVCIADTKETSFDKKKGSAESLSRTETVDCKDSVDTVSAVTLATASTAAHESPVSDLTEPVVSDGFLHLSDLIASGICINVFTIPNIEVCAAKNKYVAVEVATFNDTDYCLLYFNDGHKLYYQVGYNMSGCVGRILKTSTLITTDALALFKYAVKCGVSIPRAPYDLSVFVKCAADCKVKVDVNYSSLRKSKGYIPAMANYVSDKDTLEKLLKHDELYRTSQNNIYFMQALATSYIIEDDKEVLFYEPDSLQSDCIVYANFPDKLGYICIRIEDCKQPCELYRAIVISLVKCSMWRKKNMKLLRLDEHGVCIHLPFVQWQSDVKDIMWTHIKRLCQKSSIMQPQISLQYVRQNQPE